MKSAFLAILLLCGLTGCGSVAGAGSSAADDPAVAAIGPDAPVVMASSLGRSFNPGSTAPLNGFRAYYYNRDAPDAVIAEETVPRVALKYAWAEFHGIDSPKFGGYWVGRLRFDQSTTQEVSVSLSWSKARVIINGETVYEGGDNTRFTHAFRAGDNVVEVEFANGWHTTEFKVTFEDAGAVERIDGDDLSVRLSNARYAAPGIAYVGVYESSRRDTGIGVVVPRATADSALWLSSYEAVEWRLQGAANVPFVVVASFTPGTRVHGIAPDRVLHLDKDNPVPRAHSAGRRCSCNGGNFYCESKEGPGEVADAVQRATGLKLTGFAMEYGAKVLTVTPWTEEEAAAAATERQSEEIAAQQCRGPELPPAPAADASPQSRSDWKYGTPVTTGDQSNWRPGDPVRPQR